MPNNKTLSFSYSVILPTFKERKNLGMLVPDLLAMFKRLKKKGEIVVVDDASDDGTKEFIEKLSKKGEPVRLIERRKEKGPFSAMVRGVDEAKNANIICMDSDRVHEIFDLEKLIVAYEQSRGKNVLIGSRYIKGSVYKGKPLLNKIASKTAGLIVNYYIGLPVKDASNNFRIFSKTAWRKIRADLITEGNVGFIHELILMKRSGFKLMEVPTTYIEKRVGDSSLRKRLWKETKKFFKDLLLLRKDMVLANEK